MLLSKNIFLTSERFSSLTISYNEEGTGSALKALWGLSMQNEYTTEAITRDNLVYAKFPEAADKVQRMMQTALDNGFTSFAEA